MNCGVSVLACTPFWSSQDSSSWYFSHPTPEKVKEGEEHFPDDSLFFLLNKFSARLYDKIHRKETRLIMMQTFPVLFLNHLHPGCPSKTFPTKGWGSPHPHGSFQPGREKHLHPLQMCAKVSAWAS